MNAKAKKIKVGHVNCESCGTSIPVRKNEVTGALSFSCHECGKPGYAKNDGSDYYAKKLAEVEASNQPAAQATPAATVKTQPKFVFG